MANKKNVERVREYLNDVAKSAKRLRRIKRMEVNGNDWTDELWSDTKEELEEQIYEAEKALITMNTDEGDALCCRYVYLWGDTQMMDKFGYSRASIYRMLERGIKQFYDYMPDERVNPKNLRHK